jgi:hypothetical protein
MPRKPVQVIERIPHTIDAIAMPENFGPCQAGCGGGGVPGHAGGDAGLPSGAGIGGGGGVAEDVAVSGVWAPGHAGFGAKSGG